MTFIRALTVSTPSGSVTDMAVDEVSPTAEPTGTSAPAHVNGEPTPITTPYRDEITVQLEEIHHEVDELRHIVHSTRNDGQHGQYQVAATN